MYLSRIRLQNWRSYQDQSFVLPKPTSRKPLVLIGAMNGHGKTSLLVALYIGMYGRFGMRYCEGLTATAETDSLFYRKALRQFRRNNADADEPTTIEITFSPTLNDSGEAEVKVIRRWHFTSAGSPKQGDSFEELTVYQNDRPLKLADIDTATTRLERMLFPAHVMPAFFFDGEQAQTLITNAGTPGIKKAVEVMFGTKVLEEVHGQIKDFIVTSHQKVGGKRAATKLESDLHAKLQERDKTNHEIANLQAKEKQLVSERDHVDRERQAAKEKLSLLGGSQSKTLSDLQEQIKHAQKRFDSAARALSDSVSTLGLCTAINRLEVPVKNRLASEDLRERWEKLRSGTLERADQVISAAMPEPASEDPLLGHLSSDLRSKVIDRFRVALEQIYNPPPNGCSSEYVLGHVMGEQRGVLSESLSSYRTESGTMLRKKVSDYQSSSTEVEDLEARIGKLKNLPQEVELVAADLDRLNNQMTEALRRLHEVENEIKRLKADLATINVEIGGLQEQLAKLGPEQKRIAVAERVHRVLEGLLETLKPLAVKHLEASVTKHFNNIVDQRYKGCRVSIPSDAPPQLIRGKDDVHLIETMSGFEKRSFGIAYSLALAELTQRRLPLVIDTPLGNADSEYRPRLLRSLTDVELDQIIMLTHDEEVNGRLLTEIDNQVSAKFLVQFDPRRNASIVYANSYFGAIK